MGLDRIPASVAFCDVETTGLGKEDRIVSFGGIGMISDEFAQGRLHLAYLYLVFDPGKSNHPGAQQVHGFSDWVLAAQDPFEVHAAQVWRFLTSYELLVAHNAAFDFRFINREMTSAGLSTLTRPIYCTMKGYRALGLGGSVSLNAVCSQIKLARAGDLHDAIEDAWLAMQIYFWLHGCPFQRRLPISLPRTPSNFRHVEVGSQGAPTFDHQGRVAGGACARKRAETFSGAAAPRVAPKAVACNQVWRLKHDQQTS
jgi:DNA polymerase III subunit epsilon